MSKCDDLLDAARNNPRDFRFQDLVALAEDHGFVPRKYRGSHLILSRPGLRRPIPIQKGQNGKAKAYQVKQILAVIDGDAQDNDETPKKPPQSV